MTDLTPRENFRQKVRNICDTLDCYDEIKKVLMMNGNNTELCLKIDALIRMTEEELATISQNMVEIDTCSCDGIHTCCSSPLCPSQYYPKCSYNDVKATV